MGVFSRVANAVGSMFRRTTMVIKASIDAARTTIENRKHWANADNLSARAAYDPATRRKVRSRSRYEAENNSWYLGMLRTAANHIVGTGPRLQMLSGVPDANARIEAAWKSWCKSVGFTEKLRTAVETYWRDGEVFFFRSRRMVAPGEIGLSIRVIEGDQVTNPTAGSAFDASVEDGVRFDSNDERVEYYALDNHPGDNGYHSTLAGRWHAAANVLHLYRVERPGQVRGIPRVTPALPLFPILRRLTIAVLLAYENAANLGVYFKTNTAATTQAAASPQDFAELELIRNSGMFLPEGWSPEMMKSEHPTSTHDMVQRQVLMECSRCTCMPYLLLAGTSKDSNFSSAKMDIRNIWEPEVKSEQDHLTAKIVEGVFAWWLEEAVYVPGLLDGLPPLNQVDRRWDYDPLPTTDEVDTANAAEIRLRTLQSTLPMEYARRGVDFDSEMARGAAAFGVTPEQMKAAAFTSIFGVAPGASPQPIGGQPSANVSTPSVPASGALASLGRRQFTNNIKATQDVLRRLIDGYASETMTKISLKGLAWSDADAEALIADARDGKVDSSPQLTEVAV
jgi:capsid protein